MALHCLPFPLHFTYNSCFNCDAIVNLLTQAALLLPGLNIDHALPYCGIKQWIVAAVFAASGHPAALDGTAAY
jgi:hypothetical protein